MKTYRLLFTVILSLLITSPITSAKLALAQDTSDAVDVTYICDAGENFADCDGGPRVVMGQVSSGNFAFMPAIFPNPSVLLFDMTNIIGGQPEVFTPESGQILGIFTDDLFPQPGAFSISLPIEPTGAFLDVDNDGVEEQGVQIFSLKVGSNLFSSSHLQQLEQGSGLQSLLTDFVTGEITEGIFLLYAPDDSQDFPATAGEDGVWFSGDEPTVTLPAGYTLATLPAEGAITLDRSPQLTMTNLERSETQSPDFSEQGILESFNALIDVLIERYAYTDLRDLDWEAIRADYLPQVEQADAEQDMAAYYGLLRELAISLNDTHVSVRATNPVLIQAVISGEDVATVGATVFAVWDEMEELPGERILVLSVGEETPAAEAGWVPGTEIIAIDGDPIAERVAAVQLGQGIGTDAVRLATQTADVLRFADGQEVTIEYRLPDSDDVLSATMVAGQYGVGQASAPYVSRPPVSFERVGKYAVVRWGDFFSYILPKLAILEEALAVEQDSTSGGVILDLRGNGGGWVALYETMASYFFSADDPMSVHLFDSYFYDESVGERVKLYQPDYMISAPNPEFAYNGPVVILVNDACASACEYFSQHLQELGRATIIGQYPTSGAGGSIERVTMPAGITFQFTQGGTYFADTRIPNLEAKGVVPDIRVPVTLETELAKAQGEDPVLDAAIAFLDETSDRLVNTTWRWTATMDATGEETLVEEDGVYEIIFNSDGTVAITADCNQATGAYERAEFDALTISVETSTMALCPGDSLSEPFLESLAAVVSFSFEGERLALVAFAPDGVASIFLFEAVGEALASDEGMSAEEGFSAEALRNATYSITEMFEEPITLEDGSYAGADGIFTVAYMENSAHYGDLDRDGVEDAVVVLSERGGGTNTNYYLAAQLNQAGELTDAGAVLIDGNVQIIDLAIDDGKVMLDVTTRGPGDANCCASYRTARTFALEDGMLAEVDEATEPVRISAADLDGTSWRLVELGENQPVADDIEIVLSFTGDQISGNGSCNNYTSDFTLSDDNPFIVTFGPIAATQMACADPAGSQESAYFSALDAATIWGYDVGNLVISYGEGQDRDRLLFTATQSAAEGSEMTTTESLSGATWQWVSFTNPAEQVEIDAPELYQITFQGDGAIAVTADCNQATLGYSDEDGSLTVEAGPMTLALCGPESRSEQFVKYLSNAARYFFEDGHLFVDLFADGGTLEFSPAE